MRIPALPQPKVEKKKKGSVWKYILNTVLKRLSRKNKFFRLPPRN
ncbi:hypothetical protein MTP04_03370 [Lysinibacillus sp. PLM2]|nr:hypothetical protein MTP04_03370 [Lysinibacillus sp. PLM2]